MKNKKWIKATIALAGTGLVIAAVAPTVVSCSSSNKNTNIPYNTKNGYKDLSPTPSSNNGKDWTYSSALENFKNIWNGLSSGSQKDAITASIEASSSHFNSLFQESNYLKAKFKLNTISADNITYDLSYTTTFNIQNLTINNDIASFGLVLTTDITAKNISSGVIYSDFMTQTQTARYTDVTFTPTIHQAYTSVNNNGELVASGDYYGAIIASDFTSLEVLLSSTKNSNTTAPDTLITALEHNGFGDYSRTYTYAQATNASSSTIPWFIYVENGGINYGALTA